jgi:hypothetical protein
MINSPWNSTVLRQHKLATTLSELAIAKASGGLLAEGASVIVVTPMNENVPAFTLPITAQEYADRKLSDSKAVFMDGRSFMRRENRSDVGFVVNNQLQADFFIRIGELTALWVNDPSVRGDFTRVGDLAAQTYISWVSHAIGNKIGIDLDVSRELQIITATFYLHQFHAADEIISVQGKEKVVKMISRWTRSPVPLIQGIVNEMPYMNLLEDYVAAIHAHFSNNSRVSQINVGFIVRALNTSWFGYGAQEISAVALEYPPAFLALVEAAANAKVWRKTYLGRLVEKLATGRIGQEFSRSMEALAGQARGKDRQ